MTACDKCRRLMPDGGFLDAAGWYVSQSLDWALCPDCLSDFRAEVIRFVNAVRAGV